MPLSALSTIFVLAPLGAVETAAPTQPAEFGARPTPAVRPSTIIVVLGFFELNRVVGDPPPLWGLFDEFWGNVGDPPPPLRVGYPPPVRVGYPPPLPYA